MDQIPENLIGIFRNFDTPIILNGLEILDQEYRNNGFTTESLFCADSTLPSIVGFPRTATIKSFSEVGPELKRDKGISYYRYFSSGVGPKISVIQDVDDRPGFGAFWGEVIAYTMVSEL